MPSCPQTDELCRFLADELSADQRRQVGGHVDRCPACQDALEQLTVAPPSTATAEADHEPALAAMLARLRQTVPNRGTFSRLVRFPGPATTKAPLGQLGPYQILRLLGRGATSLVYEARDARLDRIVAIKVLRPEQAPLDSVRERFEREARALAALRHEHLVAVYDVQTPDDFPWYLVLEYVPGEPLSAWLEREVRPRQVVEVVRQAALGLAAAHEKGLIHRDLKPANLLIDAEGRARVADFGLVLDPERNETRTVEGQVLGTPAYMSPEQVRGDGHAVDARSDVWGLGVVLYEWLTGRLPFPGRAREILAQVIHEEPPPPRTVRPGLAPDLETVVLKCLAKDPAWRYASAKELSDDLGRWLDGEAILARPPDRLQRLGRWCWHHRGVLMGLALVGILLLGTGIHVLSQQRAFDEVRARNELLSLQGRASQHLGAGEEEKAEKFLLRALALSEELAERFPDLHEECVRICERLGELHDDRDEDDEAEAYFRRARQHATEWWRSGYWVGELAVARMSRRLAEVLQTREPEGDWGPELERYIKVEEGLLRNRLAEPDAVDHLHPAYLRLADWYREQGRKGDADHCLRCADGLLDGEARVATNDEERAKLLLLRARGLAEGSEPEPIARLAEELLALDKDNRMIRFQTACCYGLCLQALARKPEREGAAELRSRHEKLALEHLGRAIQLRLRDPVLLIDDAWEPLRHHPEFRKLRRQLR